MGSRKKHRRAIRLVDTSNRVMPQQMLNTEGTDKLRGIKQVSCGMYNTVLVTDKGDTYGVGYNYYGGLATGNTTGTSKPVPMLEETTGTQLKI